MSLLGFLGEEGEACRALLRAAGEETGGASAREARKQGREDLDDAVVIDGTGDGGDGGGAIVVAALEAEELLAFQPADALDGAGERAAERVAGPHGLGEELLRMLRGVVAIHEDLLADDFALALDLAGLEAAFEIHVREDIAKLCEVLGGGLRVVAGVVLGGEGIEVAAEALDGFGDLFRRAPLGAFEKEMLDEVGDAAVPRGLMPSADARPEADADAFHVRHLDGGDARAVREPCEVVGVFQKVG